MKAPNYRAIPGNYWETPWFEPHGTPTRGRFFRPCYDGLKDFFTLPPGRRFKVCFALSSIYGRPYAHRTYAPPSNLQRWSAGPPFSREMLTVRHCAYSHQLLAAGFSGDDCVDWWVEYEEIG